MSPEELLREYQGHLIPQSFSVGFVVLSYVISFIGAASTLELINRRTGFKGLYNNLLLFGAAVTMGGVSIWSMHFIGNRAIHMGNGESHIQIAFSAGITALSFFVPIIVLMVAFLAVGTNSVVSRWRVCVGGLLCGASVCGMHYLGNASIHNYTCEYRPSNVVGSAIIAVTASTVALLMFFVFRAMWANAWWKRMISALLLAGAVSGMHWCAAVGTRYRLLRLRPQSEEPGNNTTLIVVICLSVGACLTIATLAILRARNMSKSAERAQKISLASAVFDSEGRILVDPDGLIPSAIITNSFVEANEKEGFGIAHPLFHWMFQASRNWNGLVTLAGSIKKHLLSLRHEQTSNRSMDEYYESADNYNIVFRELFCDAAMSLAERTRENLTSMGILWDEILPTGCLGRELVPDGSRGPRARQRGDEDSIEKGSYHGAELSRGSLLFLVRRVSSEREVERLATAGYRFADLHQVSGIIASSMQIQTPGVETKLRKMAKYADQENTLKPGVHLGFFAIKARVNASGFDILVRRDARHLLPSTSLSISKLESWHTELLRRLNGMSVSTMLRTLEGLTASRTSHDGERRFAWKLRDSIDALQEYVQDAAMAGALFTADAVDLPGQDQEYGQVRKMVTFRLVVPIHSIVNSTNCEFIPLSFFKTHQLCQGHQLAFMQEVHREFGPAVHEAAQRTEKPIARRGRLSKLGWLKEDRFSWASNDDGGPDEKPLASILGPRVSPTRSIISTSTVNLCKSEIESQPGETSYKTVEIRGVPPSFGGIMISQEITVNVEAAKNDASGATPAAAAKTPDEVEGREKERCDQKTAISTTEGVEMGYLGHDGIKVHTGITRRAAGQGPETEACQSLTFVDVLFKHCVEGRETECETAGNISQGRLKMGVNKGARTWYPELV